MNQAELLRVLSVYRQSRKQLIKAFVTEDPELYQEMFEHKPGSVAIALAIERYNFAWLMRHPLIYQELYLHHGAPESQDEEHLFSCFTKHFYTYCKGFFDAEIDNSVIVILLQHRIKVLDELLRVNQSANEYLRNVRYQNTKAKRLFERQLDELRKQRNDSEYIG